jgi:hypothetical protein
MDEVLSQAPADIDKKVIEDTFKKYNGNIILTLAELWNIKSLPEKKRTKWEDIRDTCDAYDAEMQKTFMKRKAPTINVSEDIENELFSILNKLYNFNHRHDNDPQGQLYENQNYAVKEMNTLFNSLNSLIEKYPDMRSEMVLKTILKKKDHLLNEKNIRIWVENIEKKG